MHELERRDARDLEPVPLANAHLLVVLSGARGFSHAFGRRARHEHTLFNSPRSCRLLSYGPAPE